MSHPARAKDPFQFRHSPDSRRRLLLCLALNLTGASLLSEALRAPGQMWKAWLSLLPLYLAIRTLDPLRACLVGSVWGLAFSLAAAAGEEPLLHLTPVALLAPALAAGTYALAGALLSGRWGYRPLLLALGWVGVEICLAPLGLPHGLLAATHWNHPLAPFLASLLGYALVGGAVALTSALIFLLISDALDDPGGGEGLDLPGDDGLSLPLMDIPFISRGSRTGQAWLVRGPPLRMDNLTATTS